MSRLASNDAGAVRRRRDIQGLRAIAVGLVVLGHYLPDTVPGGFVGVDIFFVISGYLVAGSMMKRAGAGVPLKIADFYYHRARRILPAASVWVIASAAFFVWWDALLRANYLRDALAALVFVANFQASEEPGGYFAVVNPSPFRHYWSLAVEEQFYLVLPLCALIVTALGLRRRITIGIVVTLTVLSFAGGFALAIPRSELAFFMLPSRAWEFGVGLIAALLTRPDRRVPPLRIIGMLGISLSVVTMSHTSTVPGPLLLPAVLGTALLLWTVPVGSSMLAFRPLGWLGDRSYALYLTHWAPLVCVVIAADGTWPSALELAAAFAVSLVSAMALHAWVEKPLHRGTSWAPRSPGWRVATSVGLVLVGLVTVRFAVPQLVNLTSDRTAAYPSAAEVLSAPLRNPGFVSRDVIPRPDHVRDLNALYDGCHAGAESTQAVACFFGRATGPVDLVVLGDSHAATVYDGIVAAFPDQRIAFLSRTSCPVFPPEPGATACDEWRQSALGVVADLRPRLVVLTNFTTGYQSSETRAAYARRITAGWEDTVASLGSQPTVVLGDLPTSPSDPARCLARHAEDAIECDFVPSEQDRELLEVERATVEDSGLPWVDTWPWVCGRTCAVVAGRVALWRDGSGHLTPAGAGLLAPRFRAAIGPRLREAVAE